MDKRYSAHEGDQEPRDRWTRAERKGPLTDRTVKHSKSRVTSNSGGTRAATRLLQGSKEKGKEWGLGMKRGGSVSQEPARIHVSSISALALGRDAHAKTSGHSRPSRGHRRSPPAADMSSQRRSQGWARGGGGFRWAGAALRTAVFSNLPTEQHGAKCSAGRARLSDPTLGVCQRSLAHSPPSSLLVK